MSDYQNSDLSNKDHVDLFKRRIKERFERDVRNGSLTLKDGITFESLGNLANAITEDVVQHLDKLLADFESLSPEEQAQVEKCINIVQSDDIICRSKQ